MIVVLLSLRPHHIDVGFVGDAAPQTQIPWNAATDAAEGDKLKLEKALLQALLALLVPFRSATVVLVEPPLFPRRAKQAIAEALFSQFDVYALGFLQQSVCCVAGARSPHGIVLDRAEQLALPVYDYRELTPKIHTLEELNEDEVIQEVVRSVAIDTRSALRATIVDMSDTLIWRGASALASQRTVWPLLLQQRYRRGQKVWDSLYDMK